jgi:epoxyqueuosine reductase QueG
MEKWIESLVKHFVKDYEKRKPNFWEEPIIAFARADDPLFLKLKRIVSPHHLLPEEVLKEARSVICYFIPFKSDIALSNKESTYASKKWAEAYIETNKLIQRLNSYLAEKLKEHKIKSSLLPPTHNFDQKSLVSTWSHKHVSFIAGLGRFGLHHMLITRKGCCGRLGSLVISAELKPTKRPEKEFCLYKRNGSCVECVKRCIFGALTRYGLDKKKCYEVCLLNAHIHSDIGFCDVCGKCLCTVPCSFTAPAEKDIEIPNT